MKQSANRSFLPISLIETINPLEQGLKHDGGWFIMRKLLIIETINPLEQGLKQTIRDWQKTNWKIETINPLEQGLKLWRWDCWLDDGGWLKPLIH